VVRPSQSVSINQIAWVLHSAPKPAKRYIVIFKFYCDESHDSPASKRAEPQSYVVGGLFADQSTWAKIETRWKRRNDLDGVPRYHAAHLNAGTYEYDGWTKSRRLIYSKEILKTLKGHHGKLHGICCGLFVDSYRRVISPEGQIKMGHPYMVCFKTVVAAIAKQMDEANFAPEDRFAVVVDRGDFDIEAVRAFYKIKDDPRFPFRHRLESCTPGDSGTLVGLQPADFVAYEGYRLMHGKRGGTTQIRKAMESMLDSAGFMSYQFGDESLNHMRPGVDEITCEPGGLVIVPPDGAGRG
jgi:hypothetical protein